MKVAVTGSSGFIGKHVVGALLQAGHEVVEIDFANGHQYDVVEGIDRYVEDCDAIVHLAALIDINESFDMPLEYYVNNTLGTALLPQDKRIVLASSAAVYSDKPSPYGKSKQLAERLLPKNSMALRIFNPFGAGEDHKPEPHLIPSLAKSKASRPFTVYNGGKQVRDFIEVTDVASAFVAAVESEATGAYDICSNQPLTVAEVVDLMGVGVQWDELPRDNGDTMKLVGNNEPFRMATGWRPKIDVRKAIKNWREWYGRS